MKGADFVGRELIRAAIAKITTNISPAPTCSKSWQWFDLGGEFSFPIPSRRRSS